MHLIYARLGGRRAGTEHKANEACGLPKVPGMTAKLSGDLAHVHAKPPPPVRTKTGRK